MSEETTERKKLPLVLSTAGTNAFYIPYCEIERYSPNYAACLCRLEKMKEDPRYKKTWARCDEAQANGQCEAKKLRQKELDAGECLYFVPRTNHSTPPIARPEAGNTSEGWKTISTGSSKYTGPVSRPASPVSKPAVTKPKTEDENLFDGFGAAITKAVNDGLTNAKNEAVKIEPSAVKKTTPLNAESPLALAMKLKEKNK